MNENNKHMRNPAVVIRAVRDVVPDEHPGLKNKLEHIAADAGYQGPESPVTWLKLREALEEYIGPPHEDWHFKVIEVVQTHPGME